MIEITSVRAQINQSTKWRIVAPESITTTLSHILSIALYPFTGIHLSLQVSHNPTLFIIRPMDSRCYSFSPSDNPLLRLQIPFPLSRTEISM
jgi:hypothetical protein